MLAAVTLATLATALSSGNWADLKKVEKLGRATHPALVAQLPMGRSNCNVGEFGNARHKATGHSICIRCPSGKYQPLPRQTKCQACPHGKYQPYGWRGVRQMCLSCPAGRVAMNDKKRCKLADKSTLRTGELPAPPLACPHARTRAQAPPPPHTLSPSPIAPERSPPLPRLFGIFFCSRSCSVQPTAAAQGSSG